MSRLKPTENEKRMEQQILDVRKAIDEAQEYIRQCIDGPATMMGALLDIESKFDHIGTECWLLSTDNNDLRGLVHSLRRQRDELLRECNALRLMIERLKRNK